MAGVEGCAMTFCVPAPGAAGWAGGVSAVRLNISRPSFVGTYLPNAFRSIGNFDLEIDDGGAKSSVGFVLLVFWVPPFGDSTTVGPLCLPCFLARKSISIAFPGQAMSRASVGRTTQV